MHHPLSISSWCCCSDQTSLLRPFTPSFNGLEMRVKFVKRWGATAVAMARWLWLNTWLELDSHHHHLTSLLLEEVLEMWNTTQVLPIPRRMLPNVWMRAGREQTLLRWVFSLQFPTNFWRQAKSVKFRIVWPFFAFLPQCYTSTYRV